MHDSTADQRVKVSFALHRDAHGYPPADWEHLWARPVDENRVELDNIPFFVRGVSCGDMVAITRDGDRLLFDHVVESSGHRTLRAIVFRRAAGGFDRTLKSLRRQLKQRGCTTEVGPSPGLIAIDVPPAADLNEVLQLLADGERQGLWEYEEAVIR
jgi:hypothetical protein